MVADEKARAVAVGEDDEPTRVGKFFQEGELFTVGEDAEAGRFDDNGVDGCEYGIFIVPALDDDDLKDAQHAARPL